MLVDAGLVLYCGLMVLLVWRWIVGWRIGGKGWFEFANYCVLLYLLVFALLLYAVYLFIRSALLDEGKATWALLPGWMRPMMLGAPVSACIIFFMCAIQTAQHVSEIRSNRAITKHDRAVQIIALPAVYGVMAMSSLTRMYQLQTETYEEEDVRTRGGGREMTGEEKRQLFISKSETCFWVGDLYEAWALYQFGRLTLELIKASIAKRQHSSEVGVRESVAPLLTAHIAVEALAWLGVTMFLVVCTAQAGWSLYLLTFTSTFTDADWGDYNARMSQFGAAGFVASCGAIYNVHIVESTFHSYFESYRPLLKFITVKVIVSFAFFQKCLFSCLQAFQLTLPDAMQKLVKKVPFLGQILNFNEVEFALFYDSLILYECVAICGMHWWGWSAYEDWYLEDDGAEEAAYPDKEKLPLMLGQTPSNV